MRNQLSVFTENEEKREGARGGKRRKERLRRVRVKMRRVRGEREAGKPFWAELGASEEDRTLAPPTCPRTQFLSLCLHLEGWMQRTGSSGLAQEYPHPHPCDPSGIYGKKECLEGEFLGHTWCPQTTDVICQRGGGYRSLTCFLLRPHTHHL